MNYGKRVWIFPDGELPPVGLNTIPGHESVIITNTTDKKATVKITLLYTDKEPVSFSVEVKARRGRCLRTNEEKDFGPYTAVEGEQYAIMQAACAELAEYADSLGAHFAIETGPEPAVILRDFLDSLGSRGVAVNLDPANFVMVTGDDPVRAVYTLKDYIVHTHAKDGVKLKGCDVAGLYEGIEDAIRAGKAFVELPLGRGGVDFDNYLRALDEIDYRGFLTIEREVGDDPARDIAEAARFLEAKLAVL